MTAARSSTSRTWRRRPRTRIARKSRRAMRWRWIAAGSPAAASSPASSWAESRRFARRECAAVSTAAGLLDDFLAYIGDLARARGAAVAALGARAIGAPRADKARGRSEGVGDPGYVEDGGHGADRVLGRVGNPRLASLLARIHELADDCIGVDSMRAQRRHEIHPD